VLLVGYLFKAVETKFRSACPNKISQLKTFTRLKLVLIIIQKLVCFGLFMQRVKTSKLQI